MAAYGACVKAALPAVERGACEAQFAALRTCFFQAVRPMQQRAGGTHAGRLHALRWCGVDRRALTWQCVAQVKAARKGG